MLHLQQMCTLPTSPEHWFRHAFQLLGEEQISTACLHPQLWQQQQQATSSPTQLQQPTAAGDIKAAVKQVLSTASVLVGAVMRAQLKPGSTGPDVRDQQASAKHWLHRMATAHQEWQLAQMEQLGSTAPASSHSGKLASSSSSSSRCCTWLGNAGDLSLECDTAAAAATTAASADQLQLLVSEPARYKELLGTVAPLFSWQSEWTTSAAVLARVATLNRDKNWQDLYALRIMYGPWAKQRFPDQRKGCASSEEQQQEQQQQTMEKKKKEKKGSAAAKKKKGQGKTASEAASAAAHSLPDKQQPTVSAEEAQIKKNEAANRKRMAELPTELQGSCGLCAAEQAAAAAAGACSSSSGSSSSPDAAGLYGALPVPWSDPFMMRRLLWDLLGKLKPTAQAWFRDQMFMCPHRGLSREWRMVVMSLARHIWCPPGEWDEQAEQQLALLLQFEAREARDCESTVIEDQARGSYTHSLNAAFVEQGADAQAAALLSQQALLALDPHGARVQPRPELLFYTPAGFHATVCKTLMQATQLLPGLQQQGQQQQIQGAHPLQLWTAAALPAWYVWWHIGLLAYHQQQQGCAQQHKVDYKACCCHTSSSASSSSSRRTSNSSTSSGSASSSSTSRSTASSSGCGHGANEQGHSGTAARQAGSCSACSGSGSSSGSTSFVDLYNSPDAR
jgi:hypothetical protein